MVTEDQSNVIAFLESASAQADAHAERIDTHTAVVFLAGTRAWKLKRAVRFDYLDASTAERRRSLCEGEVRLNQRTAPSIYCGVRAITREPDGTLALAGAGRPIDWVVEMKRFDQRALLDRLAEAGRLDFALMAPLGEVIARFHLAAAPHFEHGGAGGIRRVIDGNAEGFAELRPRRARRHVMPPPDRSVARRGRAAADAARIRGVTDGFVRQCHGDLHLRNIVLLEGTPTLFDSIEFNDEIACIDVLYDFAFLAMDLLHRGLDRHANAIWNAYLRMTGDYGGLAAMPLFLSCRAAILAKTSATAAHVQPAPRRADELRALGRDYLGQAEQFLRPAARSLTAIGGLSGSGKSTLAIGLAHSIGAAPGAVVLRSDEIRKQLCGVPRGTRLGAEGYTDELTGRVYAEMASRAARVLRGGYSVIVDGVYGRHADRYAIERVAAQAKVSFAGFWLEAPAAVRAARVAQRRADASDADARVIRMQQEQAPGVIRWTRLDASLPSDVVRRQVEKRMDAEAQRRSGNTICAPWVLTALAGAGRP